MPMDAAKAEKALSSFDDWEVSEKQISKRFLFPSFLEAIAFVNKVATKAEKAEHHPDIDIRYNKVRVTLSTHDEGGITEKDIKLARIINDLI